MADCPPHLHQLISISVRVRASGKKNLRIQHYLPDMKENIWRVNSQQCSRPGWAKAEILFAKCLFTIVPYEPKPDTALRMCKSLPTEREEYSVV